MFELYMAARVRERCMRIIEEAGHGGWRSNSSKMQFG